jgi:Xaa-Pro aminopeptidase
MNYLARREKLRKALKKSGADALLITSFVNVTYLTGFTGDDSYLLLDADGEIIISDGRYSTQLELECPGIEVDIRRPGVNILNAVTRLVSDAKIGRLAIEADSMTVAAREKLAEKLPKVELGSTSGMVERLRQIKDKDEIAEIRRAVWQAERAFGVIRASMRGDQSEKEIADALEHQFRLFGSKCSGFPPIVAVGPRGALPHAMPTEKKVCESDFVLIDWGASQGLYKSDLTRVLVTGKISPKLRRVYGVVLSAQTQAIAAIRPGIAAHEVDAVARGVIKDAGFSRAFNHGLGHGVGLEIHEGPRLAAKSSAILKPGMVITVEPGIYLPDWGGVRIEDDVLVTRTGHEVLTSVPKQLDEILVR